MITGGLTPKAAMLSPGALGARRANQQALARLSPLGEQVIAHKSGHFPQLTEPDVVLHVLEELISTCCTPALASRSSSTRNHVSSRTPSARPLYIASRIARSWYACSL